MDFLKDLVSSATELATSVQDYALNKSELEKKLDAALSDANWGTPTSTLREIAAMVMTAPETLSAADAGGGVGRRAWMARGGAALRFVMRTVYPNRAGVFVAKMLGTVSTRDMSPDDERTLAQLSFQTGDYLDILVRSA